MNILKFLAFVMGCIIYIFKVPVKHCSSAAIARFTQLLRKNVRLKKRYTSEIQNRIKTAVSSGSLRVLLEDRSTLLRTNVDSSSGTLRLLFDCASTPTRSAVEALPKPSRRAPDHVSNMSQRNPKAEPKASRPGGEVSSSRDFCLTNFAPTPAFHAVGLGFCFTVTRILSEGDPKPTRRKFEQCWEKGGNWLPIEQVLVEKLVVDTVSSNTVEPKRYVLRSFKAMCASLILQLDTLLGLIGPVAQRALKCFLSVADYKRAYRIILTCLFLCLVSMFSLSAQTPRKDSGADGPMVVPNAKSLYIGDRIPDEFFAYQNRFVDWVSQKTFTRNLEADRDKLIILDFWASWCRPCLGSLMHLHEILPDLDTTKITIVPVNYEPINKFQHLMDRFKWNHQTIYADTFLMKYFPKRSIPHMVWIKDGRVIAKPYAKYATVENLKNVLDGGMPKMYNALNVKLPDVSRSLFVQDNAPTEVVYTKKYFKIGAYVEEYAIEISGVSETKDSLVFYGINLTVDYLLYDIFKNRIFRFYNIDNGAIKNNLKDSDRKYLALDPKELKGLSAYAKDSLYEAWSQRNLFSYEMRIPKSLGKEKGFALLQHYWAEYLKKSKGWDVHIGLTPPINYPVISASKSISETKRLFSRPLEKRAGDEYLQYDPSKEKDNEHKLSLVIAALLNKTDGYHIDVDNAFNRIGLPKDFPYAYELPRWYFTKSKLTPQELKAFLDTYGLKVEIEKKPVPVLVINN
ncbi:thiol-disulfide isomerase/thioredoxin [Sphingobacterium zeae]|uniref:Thiol-disulfide isomerase/thioredoxin n=1 Tax=Sphingobacterium zeae TaxID=1776859 RepID=A0ABU0UAH4_9SPHI|nr:TlpA disulfide reductase family protein [Sphingobacterium zeae]MDQ1151840.1 thiol-disulfide isomerase/thioredoxin [Sphingobacterium zeae]